MASRTAKAVFVNQIHQRIDSYFVCFFSDKTSSHLAAILCPVVAVGCVALVILFFVRRPGDESCFKQGKMAFTHRAGSVSGVSV